MPWHRSDTNGGALAAICDVQAGALAPYFDARDSVEELLVAHLSPVGSRSDSCRRACVSPVVARVPALAAQRRRMQTPAHEAHVAVVKTLADDSERRPRLWATMW